MSINGATESGRIRTVGGTASRKQSAYGKHIIKTIVRNGREYQLHATKGWRSYRVAS